MLAEADCLVVCAPLTPETEDLLGVAEFAALKPGAVFVNIGRGAIVDEAALLRRAARRPYRLRRAGRLPGGTTSARFALLGPAERADQSPLGEHGRHGKRQDRRAVRRELGHYLAGDLDPMSPQLDKQRLY